MQSTNTDFFATPVTTRMSHLKELATQTVRECLASGASQAEVSLSDDQALNINVRQGDVETLEFNRDRSLALTVYVGQRKGSASTADLRAESIRVCIENAVAIAKHTQADEFSGLADAKDMATQLHDLDLWHPWEIDSTAAIALATRCEAAGIASEKKISNSEGSSFSSGSGIGVYANSHGFVGAECGTNHSLSASFIVGDDDRMQRDYFYDSVRSPADLALPEVVGIEAARRAARRLDSQTLSTREAPILLSAEMSRGFIGHLLGAISGGAQYRRSSFLLDALGQQIMPTWLSLREKPFLPRASASSTFDNEGVAPKDSWLVENGILARYILGSYSARKLGLQTTGNAGGINNLIVASNAGDLAEMLQRLGTGFYVTELMGQGVNAITGDYSRGAAGFWVENGKLEYPVHEVTIAGNLKNMYAGIAAIGADVDIRGGVRTGSILLSPLMIAGT
jgi:PmbA protein